MVVPCEAGIRKGDILKVDNKEVTTGAECRGLISGYKPGDKVTGNLPAQW